MRFHPFVAVGSAFIVAYAHAGGPVAPRGWNGSNEPSLTSGQSCCIPGDLNGTGLVGGAFVLLSDNKTRFAVFALTYAPPGSRTSGRWQLLETHPVSQLPRFKVSVIQVSSDARPKVQICDDQSSCWHYAIGKNGGPFTRLQRSRE